MADSWYLFDGARQLGPLSLNELKRFLEDQTAPGVQVWRDGLQQWTAPVDLPEFAPVKPPPLPAAAEDRSSQNVDDHIAVNPKRSANFIAKNWRGEFSLGMTYWLFAFLGNVFADILAVAVTAVLQSDNGYEPRAIFASILLVWTGIVAIGIWQMVGIWRSANRHIRARTLLGKKSPWAVLAKIAVFLGVLHLGGTFLSSGWPQLVETSRMSFLGDPGIPDYSIRVMRNGTEAEIAGGFKYGLTDDFLKILNASGQVKVVHLDSIGGRIGEAVKLNKVIRSRNLDTYVASECMSACTVAFAGGVHRVLRNGAVLGFHAPSFPGLSKEELVEAAQTQRDVFAAVGFDKQFVDRALSTPSSELWKPASGDLLKAKVITAISDGGDYAMSGIGTSLSKNDFGLMLSKALPIIETLRARFPEDYDSVVQVYYGSFESGKTELESTAAARNQILNVLKKLMPLADDDILAEISDVYADQYKALGSKSAKLCYQYASGVDNAVTPSDLPPDLVRRENDLNQRAVETASSRAAADGTAAVAVWKKIDAILASKGVSSDQFDLLSTTTVPPGKYADYCAATTMLFKEISKLPQNEAGIIMRDILAVR